MKLIKKTIDEELEKRSSGYVLRLGKTGRTGYKDEVKSNKYVESVEYRIEKTTKKGAKLRKAFERPRPDLPSDAPENRTRKIVSVTLPPELLQDVNERCRELEVDRSSYVEAALRAFLKPSP